MSQLNIFGDEFDEMLLTHNPKGGRPHRIGTLAILRPDDVDINGVPMSVSTIRWHLGYCRCGAKIIISQERAEYLMSKLERQGIRAKKHTLPLKFRIIAWLWPELVKK